LDKIKSQIIPFEVIFYPIFRWFSSGPSVSSTNKTERHDIAEILLKVALNAIKPTNQPNHMYTACVFGSKQLQMSEVNSNNLYY
jgi:hypothetical protein